MSQKIEIDAAVFAVGAIVLAVVFCIAILSVAGVNYSKGRLDERAAMKFYSYASQEGR